MNICCLEKGSTLPVLSGKPLAELEKVLAPLPRFRSVQIIKWITSGVSSFDQMRNLPVLLQKELTTRFMIRPDVSQNIQHGEDGTVKLIFNFSGVNVEAVLLKDNSRYTACLSTQAGCPCGCVFCKTGSMGLIRNLDSSEIVEQFFRLREIGRENLAKEDNQFLIPHSSFPISNIVVMGMGEPLLNLPELRRALAVITCSEGLNYSKRRITVSTCGITGGIIDLADNGPDVRLALSLTTADEALRKRLMPVTVNEPLGEVKKALRYFQDKGGGRITLETVLLGGINTREEDAVSIAGFVKGLEAVVNLIPWNPVAGLMFEGKPLREPGRAEIKSFTRRLESLGLKTTRRFRRGRGVAGACGQLGS